MIDWEKCDETIQANAFQAIVAAVITGQVKNHIEAFPCDPQIVNTLLPSISDTTVIISKVITWSSGHSHPTHDQDPTLNPRCMTTLDWVEVQFKGKTIGQAICLYKSKELQW